MKNWLIGKSLNVLVEIVKSLELPTYTAKQIADWIYKKRAISIDEMSNLSKITRERLKSNYLVGGSSPIDVSVSNDGTKKYLFPTEFNVGVESVLIPDDDRQTICVSSQVGCKMGCKFCMTARMGFKGNLTAGEIISQFLNIEESKLLTNAVFMGMGEPLDNYDEVLKSLEILTSEWGFGWSPKRITLSTIGVLPNLKRFLDESKVHIAVSMHNPNDEVREELMPVQKAWKISQVIDLIRSYDFSGQRRVSFEYIMLEGWNDSKREADSIIKLLRGLECRVNLIRFHSIPDSKLKSSSDFVIEQFKKRLTSAGVVTTIRASRGEDIAAACGLLSTKNEQRR